MPFDIDSQIEPPDGIEHREALVAVEIRGSERALLRALARRTGLSEAQVLRTALRALGARENSSGRVDP